MYCLKYIFLVCLLSLAQWCEGKKILLIPSHLTSHMLELGAITEGLKQNGHEIYMLVSKSFQNVDKVLKPGMKPLYFNPNPDNIPAEKIFSTVFEKDDMVLVDQVSASIYDDCRAALNDKELMKEVARIEFDFAVVNGFVLCFCNFLLPYLHGIPYVYSFSAVHPWHAGIPSLPSFVPLASGASFLPGRMSFYQRLENLFHYVMVLDKFPISGRTDRSLLEEFAPDVKSWESLVYKSVLFLETRDFILEEPSVKMPNFIQTPGITAGPAKVLSKELEDIMQSSEKGVVLVSFGSMASNFPDYIIDKLIKAFNRLDETIIWKFSGKSLEDVRSKVNSNIHILPWIPQNDILGHSHVRAFVTHCGNNGQYESVYHGVPMVGMPIFAEQHHNAFRQQEKGYGLSILPHGIMNFTVDELVSVIKEVITNPDFKTNVHRASEIMKDLPMNPVETMTYWLEHILKFGPDHLLSKGIELPWYQYFMFDILLFIVAVCAVVLCVVVVTVRGIVRCCIRGRKEKVA